LHLAGDTTVQAEKMKKAAVEWAAGGMACTADYYHDDTSLSTGSINVIKGTL